jgi:hypothetical protein
LRRNVVEIRYCSVRRSCPKSIVTAAVLAATVSMYFAKSPTSARKPSRPISVSFTSVISNSSVLASSTSLRTSVAPMPVSENTTSLCAPGASVGAVSGV